jgi:hypothetical protein
MCTRLNISFNPQHLQWARDQSTYWPYTKGSWQKDASESEGFMPLKNNHKLEDLHKRTAFPAYMLIPFLIVVLAFVAILAFPATSGFAIAGFVHLNIICYGIINDMLAVRNSMEYFRFGHQPGQLDRVAIPSTRSNVQAFHWGVLATWLLSAIGAGIVGVIAAFAAPVTPFIYPLISALVIGVLVGAELYSKSKASSYEHNTYVPSLPSDNIEANKNWHRCSNRNTFGYATLPLMGITLGIGIATSALNVFATILPVALLPIASPLIPIIIGAPMMLFVGGMFVNYLMHRNTVEADQTLPRKFVTNPDFEPTLPHKLRQTQRPKPKVELTQELAPEPQSANQATNGTANLFAPLKELRDTRAQQVVMAIDKAE